MLEFVHEVTLRLTLMYGSEMSVWKERENCKIKQSKWMLGVGRWREEGGRFMEWGSSMRECSEMVWGRWKDGRKWVGEDVRFEIHKLI